MKQRINLIKKIVLISALLLVIFLAFIIFRNINEIRTVIAMKELDGVPVYYLKTFNNYAFDEYLKTGAKDEDALKDFIRNKIDHGIIKFTADNFGCSAFFAKTPDGDIIFARNLDTHEAFPCIVETKEKNTYHTIGVSNLARLDWKEFDPGLSSRISCLAAPYASMDGMNEYGLAAALFTAGGSESSIDVNKVTLYDITVVRAVLDKCKNVDEAVEFLKQYNIAFESPYPSHYMFVDADGNSAVIEYVSGKMEVIKRQKNYQICTNFILYHNPGLSGFGSDRYLKYQKVLSESDGVISTEDALTLLENNTIPGDEQWSAVYNLTKLTMTISFPEDYSKIYTYSLK